MTTAASHLPPPADATLTVTKAASVLGVHPNTIRAWSDAGRLRYYRINARGDRRYRLGDLQRFLADAAEGPAAEPARGDPARHPRGAGLERRMQDRRVLGPFGSRGGRVGRRPGVLSGIDDVDAHSPQVPPGAGLRMLASLGQIAASVFDGAADLDTVLGLAARAIHRDGEFLHASIWRLQGDRLVPVAAAANGDSRLVELPRTLGVLGAALASSPAVVDASPSISGSLFGQVGRELAVAIDGPSEPWGVLLVCAAVEGASGTGLPEVVAAAAAAVATIVGSVARSSEVAHRLHRAEALRRIAADIGSRLDLDQILAGLADHAMVLLGGDRASVLVYEPGGSRRAAAARGLSASYLSAITPPTTRSLVSAAVAAGGPVFSVGFRDDPRAAEIRAAVVQEGFDTLCVAPLFEAEGLPPLGSLNIYHDQPHPWSDDELETMRILASQASAAIRAARTYAQLAQWAAQLQSIQQLGTRLSRLNTVEEIGAAIATELRQLIDYHNVRVYRLRGEDLIPVAMKGQIGEYVDETPEQLQVKLGSGITGWVAQHGQSQILHDAVADPRANTIAGTEEDLDESMLLAPMLHEDQVLGVLVLSKLGLRQFSEDDLRLLEIYANFAAQAMANADATGRLRSQSAALERQVRSQRDLLHITETILTTLDVRSILDAVADRLGDLVGWDNIAIHLVEGGRGALKSVIAKGSHAEFFVRPFEPGDPGLVPWVMEHNEPVLVVDEFTDPRVRHGADGPIHASLICLPLRGRDGAIGVLTVERVGEDRVFGDDEFDLVKLFAAQVSIALQNAQAHGVVARRAETDNLTGLLNHGSFRERLATAVAAGEPFSVMMVDLDHFKLVNDTFGHPAGDDLLRQTAGAIVGASRETDAAFRYGGDEFAVILAGTDAAHVGPIAERIRGAIAGLIGSGSGIEAAGLRLDASAGVATYPTDGATPDEILLAADRACFVAKRGGGGRVATAGEGMLLAGEFALQVPTPIDTTLLGANATGAVH
ncbi:MAG: hypothetical protein HW391_40 [Chloroflexi bacterium]|nr:hypothetical protein [Chloroflexota bacterium]